MMGVGTCSGSAQVDIVFHASCAHRMLVTGGWQHSDAVALQKLMQQFCKRLYPGVLSASSSSVIVTVVCQLELLCCHQQPAVPIGNGVRAWAAQLLGSPSVRHAVRLAARRSPHAAWFCRVHGSLLGPPMRAATLCSCQHHAPNCAPAPVLTPPAHTSPRYPSFNARPCSSHPHELPFPCAPMLMLMLAPLSRPPQDLRR